MDDLEGAKLTKPTCPLNEKAIILSWLHPIKIKITPFQSLFLCLPVAISLLRQMCARKISESMQKPQQGTLCSLISFLINAQQQSRGNRFCIFVGFSKITKNSFLQFLFQGKNSCALFKQSYFQVPLDVQSFLKTKTETRFRSDHLIKPVF